MKTLLFFVLLMMLSACKDNESTKFIKEVDENFTKELVQKNASLSDDEKIEKIKSFYENKLKTNFPQVKLTFIEKTHLKDLEGFVFEFEVAGEKAREIIFVKDEVFFAEGVFFKDLSSLRDEAQNILSKTHFKNILKSLKDDKDFIITLGKGQKELFVFSDPECPYCKKHLEKINEAFLKTYTLNFIFYSIHDNHKITALLYKDLKDKASDEDKLKVIRHYFFEKINYESVSKEEEEKFKALFEKYKNLGVLYTPFEIEKDDRE